MFSFFIGTIFGSFLCVLAERWPKRENFWIDRSHCPHCKNTLHSFELIPILSYLMLKGRCRSCHSPIPIIYLIAEVTFGTLLWAILDTPGAFFQLPVLVTLVWLTMAFVLSLADIFYLSIDSLLLIFFTSCLWLVNWRFQLSFHWFTAIICLIIYLYLKRYALIGEGDLLLFICWFPWLSLEQVHLLLLVASLSGIIYYMLKRILFRVQLVHIPFVPFLSLGLVYILLT